MISRKIGYRNVRLITFIVLIIYCSHILSCLLYGVRDVGKEFYQDTWVSANDYAAMSEDSLFDLYMIGMYWAMMTLTTVGYGDIVATNNLERSFFWVVMMGSAFVFSYLLGNIIDAVTSASVEYQEFETWRDELNKFLSTFDIPKQLKRDTYKFAHFLYGEIENRNNFTNHTVLDKVSPALRRQLLYVFYGKRIHNMRYFKDAPLELVGRLCEKLVQYVEAPDQYIFRYGTVADGMHMFISGEAYTSMDADHDNSFLHKGSDDERSALIEGDIFGFECLVFTGHTRRMSVYTRQVCITYHLSIDDFQAVMKNFPAHARKLRSVMIKDLWKSILTGRVFLKKLKSPPSIANKETVIFDKYYNQTVDTKVSRRLKNLEVRAETPGEPVLDQSLSNLEENDRYLQHLKFEKMIKDVEKIKSLMVDVYGKQAKEQNI